MRWSVDTRSLRGQHLSVYEERAGKEARWGRREDGITGQRVGQWIDSIGGERE
jgi:hypothetical protein